MSTVQIECLTVGAISADTPPGEVAAARLAAAAPKMAAALVKLTNGFKYSTEVCEIARAALRDAGL